ncbi:SDR family oxidoreductase [Neobacillus sp. Marseille-QA0830]
MGKVIFVTGASRGLGLAMVEQFLKNGCFVWTGARTKETPELTQLRGQYPGMLECVELDVSDDQSVQRAKEFIFSKTEKIDWLINNAAILGEIQSTLFDRLDFDEMLKVYNTNALGPLRMANALIPLVLNSDSKLVVNISSEAGSIQDCRRVNQFAYTMSKAALNMQSNLLHNQLAERGGRVLTLHPGWIQSYMQGKLDEAADLTPEQAASYVIQVISNYEASSERQAKFLDYLGNERRW